MPDMTPQVAEQAAAIHAAMNADMQAARNNPDLSLEGRRNQIARVYGEAKRDMDALQAKWASNSTTTAVSLTQQLFGATSTSGADAISARDADDRAAQIETGAQALALLERAENNGDGVLARALAQRAFSERGNFFGSDWDPVLERYLSTRPGVAKKMEDLAAAARASIASGIQSAGVFFIVEPTEILGMSPTTIRAAAEGR